MKPTAHSAALALTTESLQQRPNSVWELARLHPEKPGTGLLYTMQTSESATSQEQVWSPKHRGRYYNWKIPALHRGQQGKGQRNSTTKKEKEESKHLERWQSPDRKGTHSGSLQRIRSAARQFQTIRQITNGKEEAKWSIWRCYRRGIEWDAQTDRGCRRR